MPDKTATLKCNCGADRTGPSAEAHLPSCPMAMETAGELEKRAREFLVKWDYDHDASCYSDVDMLTEFAHATAQAIERMLRERAAMLRTRATTETGLAYINNHSNDRAKEIEELADQIRKEYGL